MKSPRKVSFILLCGLTLGVVAILGLQNPNQHSTNIAFAIPAEVTPPIEGGEILPVDILLTRVLGAARSRGLQEDVSAEDLDASKGVFTTFRQLLAFQGSDPNPPAGSLGEENLDRPIFIMPIIGSGFRPLGGLPDTDPDATPVVYYAMIVTVFADTGLFLHARYIPVGVSLDDFSPLRDPLYGTPTPSDTLPLPDAPEGDMPGSS